MLNYEDFKNEIKQKLKNYLPQKYSGYAVEIYRVNKVNQSLDGICLVDKDSKTSVSPVVYLDEVYSEYCKTESLEMAVERVAELMAEGFLHAPDSLTIEHARENIVLVLINYEHNKELLKKVPHIKYLDMVFVFRWIIEKKNGGVVGGIVSNDMLKALCLTADELFKLAKENTKRILPPKIEALHRVISRITNENIQSNMPVYILSNELVFEGAANIIYTELLEQLRLKLGGDLYIVPSSINEVLVMPKALIDAEYVRRAIAEVNGSTVAKEEQLSDSLYIYDGELKLV